MILYNTLMGFCAALTLLISVNAVSRFDKALSTTNSGIALLVTGVPLTVLSFLMATTWPLKVNLPINIAFSEPSLVLGVLAIVGGVFFIKDDEDNFSEYPKPVLGIISALGLMLFAISMAIFRFNLVGDAPAVEPISGQVQGWENTTFGIMYLIASLGCLMAWFIPRSPAALNFVRVCWATVGVFFLLFSCLNYYTHIGLLTCTTKGVCLPW